MVHALVFYAFRSKKNSLLPISYCKELKRIAELAGGIHEAQKYSRIQTGSLKGKRN